MRTFLIHVGPGCEELFDHGSAAAFAGERQGRGTVVIGDLDIGSGTEQKVGEIQVVAIGGPLEGRGSVRIAAR